MPPAPPAPTQGLYSPTQAAAWLAVSVRTVQLLMADGTLPTVLVRSKRRLTHTVLAAYVSRLERERDGRRLKAVR